MVHSYLDRMTEHNRRFLLAGVLFVLFAVAMIGTAVAGLRGATQRETLVRARVWCEALIERDALRYQETFRRDYFRGEFDRFANLYREASEASILASMPLTTDCRVEGRPRGPDNQGDVFVTVARIAPDGHATRVDLRMRREAGFWVIQQLVELH